MAVYHISDLHISSKVKANQEVLEKLVSLSGIFQRKRDTLVVTGDITEDGLSDQYSEALKLLEMFTGAIVVVPGNHDLGIQGNLYSRDAYGRWKKFVKAICPRYFHNKKAFIYVDSCKHTLSPFDFARGKVGFWWRQYLNFYYQKYKGTGIETYVCLHHDPFQDNPFLRLEDAFKFGNTVLGKFDNVLFGHTHKEYKVANLGTTFHSAPKFERVDDIFKCAL